MKINSAQYKALNKKKSKHGNKWVKYDGINFQSIREKNRYIILKMLEKNGTILELQLQVKYEICPKTDLYRKIDYVADFVYIENGKIIVEDSKGFLTDIYKLKRKLMYHIHGIEIKET